MIFSTQYYRLTEYVWPDAANLGVRFSTVIRADSVGLLDRASQLASLKLQKGKHHG